MSGEFGIVVIGLNEGEKLRECLASCLATGAVVVYCDSGSTDGSTALAEEAGTHVLLLDASSPFTPARGRNEGFGRLVSLHPDIEFVQFVDGDCELQSDWPAAAIARLRADEKLAVVFGRNRERHPEQSIYNRLADMEWGAAAVGGNAMVRAAAFARCGGFTPFLVAGEEAELCQRLRLAGWTTGRLPVEMTRHDAELTSFGAWWKRSVRSGYGPGQVYHECYHQHGERLFGRMLFSAHFWSWGVWLLAATFAAAGSSAGLPRLGMVAAVVVLLAVPGQMIRVAMGAWRRRCPMGLAVTHGALTLVGKWGTALGHLRYLRRRGAGNGMAYLTGEYPRASHTFIQREVAELRRMGRNIQTFSVRRPGREQRTSADVEAEYSNTIYLLKGVFWRGPLSQMMLLAMSPRRYFSGIREAISLAPPGLVGSFKQWAYFIEAGILTRRMRRLKLVRLHNHFSDSSCTVAAIAAKLGGFPFSFTLHGPADFLSPRHWKLERKIERADFVACISDFARRQAMFYAPAAQPQKLCVVHCGVEPGLFEARVTQPGLSRLLFVGRFTKAKGLAILLEAFELVRKEIPQATLTLVGDGPEKIGARAGVEMVGYQSQEAIRGLLKQADVFVMTSLAEGVPVVLMEAMAAGVPVVAPRIAGIAELVEHEKSGLLTPAGDAGATAAAVLRLLNDRGLAERFAVAGRERVARDFNLHVEAARLLSRVSAPIAAREARERTYVLITPCRDEAGFVERCVKSVAGQTVRPALWVIVDDGSTDGTGAALDRAAASHDWIRIVHRQDRGFRKLGGGVIDAFYAGYESIDATQYEYMAKFDLDLEVPPRYFELLMQRMEDEPRMGTCSGKPYFVHPVTGALTAEACGDEQSVGMAKFYRVACFEQIGGFVRELMWDGIDGHRCRMLGWMAASWDHPDLRFLHLRPMGTSDRGWWTGRVRHGWGQYFMGTGFGYLTASCVYRLMKPPVVVGSVAVMWGYLRAFVAREKRYGDGEFRRFLRRYQWECLVKGKAFATGEENARGAGVWRRGIGGKEKPPDGYPGAS